MQILQLSQHDVKSDMVLVLCSINKKWLAEAERRQRSDDDPKGEVYIIIKWKTS